VGTTKKNVLARKKRESFLIAKWGGAITRERRKSFIYTRKEKTKECPNSSIPAENTDNEEGLPGNAPCFLNVVRFRKRSGTTLRSPRVGGALKKNEVAGERGQHSDFGGPRAELQIVGKIKIPARTATIASRSTRGGLGLPGGLRALSGLYQKTSEEVTAESRAR